MRWMAIMRQSLLVAGMLIACAAHASSGALEDGLAQPYKAPKIVGIDAWLNSKPLTMAQLKGKVVLVDFWTYSCINCVRTLPYVTQWDATYRDKGLVIIGVHSREFEFEKARSNVQAALLKYGIHYPVALDNHLATWNSFHNRYWPAHYLIDRQGNVVYTHFGEGSYDVMEHNIRVLLGLSGDVAAAPSVNPTAVDQTPETYLGTARAERFTDATPLPLHHWALSGDWQKAPEHMTASKGAQLHLHFHAGKVYLVLGTASGQPLTAHVTLDGKPVDGGDVHGGVLTVSGHRLYQLMDSTTARDGLLSITADKLGLEAYAFTFGG